MPRKKKAYKQLGKGGYKKGGEYPKKDLAYPPKTTSPNQADTEMTKLMSNKGSPRARV